MQRTLQLRRNILGMVLIALLVLAPGLSAPTAAYEPVDAEKLIKGCDIAPYKGMATTAQMATDIFKSIACLENVFLDQVEIMFDPKQLSRKKAHKKLIQLRESSLSLYKAIYLEHKGCMCGTIGYLGYPNATLRILQNLIRQTIKQRNSYRNQIKKRKR
ncbi:MAG: hypothetical protein HN658_06025 [Rhodospirillales bacterium]|nr:hypothetical protein [Rhodospirillales bacterium]MBT4005914.1 hypothetical protein [Rhodospirillales bacterium]MBT5077249.1 hypothetical protein [Rhodospirillales bacterium]MBT5113668.1 hypothetical protein [Rhodospirillales bacterium]MBT5674019.1 hypothetical protein [Rhodospirillales bacterium]